MTMPLNRASAAVVAVFRIVIGLLFACHGIASLFGVLGGSHGTGGAVPVGAWPGWYAAVIELVSGALVLVGLFTRPAAILGSGAMAYAYFTVHQQHGLLPLQNGGEPAALFCWSLLVLAAVGPGALALDGLWRGIRAGQPAGPGAVASTRERQPARRHVAA
jgi:putative oxidoreductase